MSGGIAFKYRIIKGYHVITSKDVPGLYVASKDMHKSFRDLPIVLNELYPTILTSGLADAQRGRGETMMNEPIIPGGKQNQAAFEMTRRVTESRAFEAVRALHQIFPFGKTVNLPNGEVARIKPFVEPRVNPETGKPEFGFDVQEKGGKWHLEFFVRNTGWGAIPVADMTPITKEQAQASGFQIGDLQSHVSSSATEENEPR